MRLPLVLVLAACGSREPAEKGVTPFSDTPADGAGRGGRISDGAPQLIVGVVDGWDGVRAELRRYERDGDGWREVGGPIAAVVGGKGVAWGRGLHAQPATKVEGDGRAPAGAFAIGRAWSEPLGDSWRCVDDAQSRHYNDVFDAAGVAQDWASAEEMRIDPYRLVVEIDHNPDDVPGGGSCIFFHVWDGPDDTGTLGCTAMAEADLAALIAWLQPGARYVLLPRDERAAVAASWGLP